MMIQLTKRLTGFFRLAALGLGLSPLLAMSWVRAAESTLSPLDPRCEYARNPLGLDSLQPRLAWKLEAPDPALRNQKQTAYRVLVASTAQALGEERGDLWDSGQVTSEQSIQVPYQGRPLRSAQQVFWKVQVWDQTGQPSGWSRPATWTMGLLSASDWRADWIGADGAGGALPLFRRAFEVPQPVRRAVLFVCGLGFYELHLNGQRIGQAVLDPGWTDYRKRCLHSTYDVTRQIASGRNALGLLLGNGMYNVTGGRYVKFKGSFGPPKLILHLRLEFTDGTSAVVASDESWKTSPGPIQFSCIFGGEDYDARRELEGWDRPGFDDSQWPKAKTLPGPGGRLAAQVAPPIRVLQEFPTAGLTQPKPGVFVYDLGQNFSGWPRLKVKGPAGATVKMTPGELLDRNGLVSQRSSGGPVWFSYTLKGGGPEDWTPRFSYYGFRYVQLEGAWPNDGTAAPSADAPRVLELRGQFVCNSSEVQGNFACSNPLVNRIHDLIDAAIRSNFQSVLTDCPHREKLGWLEVSHLLSGGVMFNFDAAQFYTKILQDMRDAQLPDGLVPDIAPEFTVFAGGFRDSPEWGSACVVNPWQVYQMYGDTRILEENYDAMKRYTAYLAGKAQNQIVGHGLGDWYDIGPRGPGESQLTSKGVTATALYFHDLTLLQKTAVLLGKLDEARRFEEQAAAVRSAFNQRFFRPDTGGYDRGSQTAQAMPLVLGLASAEARPAVLENLVRNVRTNGNRVTAGDVGFVYLVRALSDGGRGDVLYDLIVQTNGPGYAYQLAKGATTLTEAWDTNPSSSQNHCMLGHAEEWFYRGLGGLSPDPAGPGFKRFFLQPQVVGDLTWTKVSYVSGYGPILSEWHLTDGRFDWQVTVPPNSTATLWLPVPDGTAVLEGGKPLAQTAGVRFLRREANHTVLEAGSGRYRFACPRP